MLRSNVPPGHYSLAVKYLKMEFLCEFKKLLKCSVFSIIALMFCKLRVLFPLHKMPTDCQKMIVKQRSEFIAYRVFKKTVMSDKFEISERLQNASQTNNLPYFIMKQDTPRSNLFR